MANNITEIAVDGGTRRIRDLSLGKKLRKTIDKIKAGTVQQEASEEVESFLWEIDSTVNKLEHPEKLEKIDLGD